MTETYEVRWYVTKKRFKKKIVHKSSEAISLASSKKDLGYQKVLFERIHPPRPRLIQEI